MSPFKEVASCRAGGRPTSPLYPVAAQPGDCGIWASMNPSRPFLNTTYGAYFAREVPPPDDELVRVGPGAPCGEYLRRFWQPVAFARDLKDLPVRIRIMS